MFGLVNLEFENLELPPIIPTQQILTNEFKKILPYNQTLEQHAIENNAKLFFLPENTSLESI